MPEDYASKRPRPVIALLTAGCLACTTAQGMLTCDALGPREAPWWSRGYDPVTTQWAERAIELLTEARKKPISEAEKLIIMKREMEAGRLAPELQQGQDTLNDGRRKARKALDDAGVMFSGFNSIQKIHNPGKARDESLHVVLSTVVAAAGGAESLAGMPRSDRRALIEKIFRRMYTVPQGELKGLYEQFVNNTTNLMAGIGTINHARYRSVPREGTGPLSVEAAQAMVDKSASGGMNSTATTPQDTVSFYPSKAKSLVIFVYPEGTQGAVINGEGTVKRTAEKIRVVNDSNPGIFVPNEIMTATPKDGWRVESVGQTSGTAMVNGTPVPYEAQLVYLAPR